jgi:hypothetical protein
VKRLAAEHGCRAGGFSPSPRTRPAPSPSPSTGLTSSRRPRPPEGPPHQDVGESPCGVSAARVPRGYPASFSVIRSYTVIRVESRSLPYAPIDPIVDDLWFSARLVDGSTRQRPASIEDLASPISPSLAGSPSMHIAFPYAPTTARSRSQPNWPKSTTSFPGARGVVSRARMSPEAG